MAHPPQGCEVVNLRSSSGTKIAGMFGPSTIAGAKTSLAFFYGNGMCMADSLDIFNRLRGLGFNVMLVDYEGYGMSGGKPTEPGCYAAADAAYEYLLSRKEVDAKRIVSTGWSLGSGVAIDLAGRRRIAGLVTFSAFTNTDHMSERLVSNPRDALKLVSKFDNEAKIALVTCPIFMVHGTNDPLVPIDMLDSLVKCAKIKVATLRIEGAAHNDLFFRGGDRLYDRVRDFINSLPDAPPTPAPAGGH